MRVDNLPRLELPEVSERLGVLGWERKERTKRKEV